MTPEAAVYQLMSSFGMPAYAETSVPDDAEYPYLTYSLPIGGWMEGDVNVTVNLWFRTTSEAVPNAKVREMGETIPIGGVTIPCDGGMLFVKRGSPWAQPVQVSEDVTIKQRYVNVDIDFIVI